jgi:hypothetical protein
MKKFPRIVDYINAYHPKLGELIDALALDNSFVPRKGGGITFLVPDDAWVARVEEIASTDEPEPATDMILSLLIPVLLETVKDWQNYSSDMPNLLGRQIEIASIREDSVTLKNGSVITKNEIFKPFTKSGNAERGNMAVWNIKGEISQNAPKTNQKPGAKKRAVANNTRNVRQDDNILREFVKLVEAKEIAAMRQRGLIRSVKLTVLCNYLRYLSQHQSELEFKEHLDYFRHICDPAAAGGIEAAFYLVFCCRDATDMAGVRRPGLHDTSSLIKIVTDPTVDLFASVDRPVTVISASLGYPADPEICETVQAMLEAVRPRTVDDLVKTYDAWVAKTEGYAAGKFKSIPGLKLLIDEFKHYCSMHWLSFRQSADGSRLAAYKDFLYALERWGHPHVLINNPDTQSWLAGIQKIYKKTPKLITSEHISLVREFLSEDGAFRSERQEIKPDDAGLRYMSLDQEYANEDMGLSSRTMTELRNYAAKHGGKLPDDLLK